MDKVWKKVNETRRGQVLQMKTHVLHLYMKKDQVVVTAVNLDEPLTSLEIPGERQCHGRLQHC